MRRGPVVETIRVLLIESESSGTSRAERLLGRPRGPTAVRMHCVELTRATALGEAFELLDDRHVFDVVLFDWDFPGAPGPAALVRLYAAAPDLPIIVLVGDDEHEQAVAAIRQGAQDWIPKKELSASMLSRAIRHAIARKRLDLQQRRQVRRLQKARSRTQRQTVALRERARELDAMNSELDDFVYVVSHDLKEPLRGIRAYCGLFAEDYESCIDRAGANRLQAIMAMCGRLETQIGDLLTYYRVGRIRPSVTRVDLAEVVEGQVAVLRVMVDRRNAAVRVKGTLPIVQGHPVLLGMLFGNLISNGLKYNRSKRPAVEIGTVADEPSTLYVRDNGIGIAPEHHEEVFALFRRLHGRKEFEGSGAGLTIVRKIIRSYGGRIWLESEPGRGATFFFSLPTVAVEPTKPPHWMTIDGHKADEPAAGTPGSVLESLP